MESRKVSLSVMDNCLARFDTSFEGIREDGDESQEYNMAISLTSIIPASETDSASLSSLEGKYKILSILFNAVNLLNIFVRAKMFGSVWATLSLSVSGYQIMRLC